MVFAMASDEHLLRLDFGEDYRASTKGAFYTVETHTVFIDELVEGESLAVDTTVVGGDLKRVHLFHELRSLDRRNADRHRQSACDAVAAAQESVMLHGDTAIGRVAPMRDDLHG